MNKQKYNTITGYQKTIKEKEKTKLDYQLCFQNTDKLSSSSLLTSTPDLIATFSFNRQPNSLRGSLETNVSHRTCLGKLLLSQPL